MRRHRRLPGTRAVGGDLLLVDPSERRSRRPARRRPTRRGRCASERPKTQWPGKVVRSDRGRRRVVEDDEVGGRAGLERPSSGSANAGRRSGRPRRALRAASPHRRRRGRPRGPGSTRPGLLEHVAADPVGAERDPRTRPPRRARARPRCSCSSARCGRATRRAGVDEGDLVVVEVDAVGEQRARSSAPARRGARRPAAAARRRIALVGAVLGAWTGARRSRARPASTQAASVSSESVNEACAPTMPARAARPPPTVEEAAVLGDAGAARSGPSRSVVS